MPRPLSKSKFTAGLQCGKRLWLEVRRPDLVRYDEATRQKFRAGTEVGLWARKLFPEGVEIEEDFRRPAEAMAHTKRAVASGATALFEAAAGGGGGFARADILVKAGPDDGRWDLLEVKSAASVKENYLWDLALQRHVFESAGYPIRKA